jgi:acyl-coenzyme A thioesterase PaaI-like protein
MGRSIAHVHRTPQACTLGVASIARIEDMSGQQRELTLRFLAQPTDVNYGGKVHGGMVMTRRATRLRSDGAGATA